MNEQHDEEQSISADVYSAESNRRNSSTDSSVLNSTIAVIVPTFLEVDNIEPLVKRIFSTTQNAGIATDVIIVDDNSADGIDKVVSRLKEDFSVKLIVRRDERGLASAAIRGFREANHNVLVVMDADLQHPPESIPELVAPILADTHDLVVGSRYVVGASVAPEWTSYRSLNSRIATWLASPLARLSDPMSGFCALRKTLFDECRGRLNPVGYKIVLELAVKSRRPRIVEIPIEFGNRFAGESKLNLKEQINFVRHVVRLYLHRYGPLVFGVVALAVAAVIWLTIRN